MLDKNEDKIIATIHKDITKNIPKSGANLAILCGIPYSGKSTIAKLISGFYRIDKGSIRIGGKDLTEYSEAAIIKDIAFVFQDSKLFKTSIFENVLAGNPRATKAQVFEAMKLAGCEARWLAEAAQVAEASGADVVDINMGCPAKKVVGGWAGSGGRLPPNPCRPAA